MFVKYQFVDGVDPDSTRARELAISERKSLAAKNAHQRRKARMLQSLGLVEDSNELTNHESAPEAQICKQPSAKQSREFAFSNSTFHQFQAGSDANNSAYAKQPATKNRVQSTKGKRLVAPVRRISAQSETGSHGAFISVDTSNRLRHKALCPFGKTSCSTSTPLWKQPPTQLEVLVMSRKDRRAFDFWRLNTATVTARYSSFYQSVWSQIIPKLAFSSSAVRHMILAHGLAHESSLYDQGSESEAHSTKALYCYHEGIKSMSACSNRFEVLVAALLAYCYEAVKNNSEAAMIHLEGCQAVMGQDSHDDTAEFTHLKDYLRTMIEQTLSIIDETENSGAKTDSQRLTLQSSRGKAFFRKREGIPYQHTSEPRAIIVATIDRIVKNSLDPGLLQEIKLSLGEWFVSIRDWDLKSTTTIERDALLLLFDFAMGLLPAKSSGKLSYESNPRQWESLLDTASKYLTSSDAQQSAAKVEDEEDLLVTLETLVAYMIKHIPDPDCQRRASAFLQRIAHRKDLLQKHAQPSGAINEQVNASH